MKPLIFDFEIERTEHNSVVSYIYDEQQSLNVYQANGTTKPFIDLCADDLNLATQTRVIGENSDASFELSELGTKTKIGGEKEDLHDMLLELKTKTFSTAEKDD
ncbi:hypothetical protein [Mucilaginibacter myungsuensis]|uniref:Uncharacterized protein n=1 Tax=Mucilaginibacter myungsuensis TaxID=649104 RepID=A0A929KU01_9SPHI|nr:hypothetical protein [Mucilaginibacter myungsuensis]MBE9661524.1 hypothetical protein [Mucilaginibacter myungsuensis]MDN3597667.1 hypothetical protein [Mucilaginibacter myungsuensis]